MSEERSTVSALAAAWASLEELLGGLDEAAWDLPTDCAGWTVKDQVSHLVGIELLLSGAPAPEPVDAPYVRNPLGAANEGWVAARRAVPAAAVLGEFRDVTARRLARLRGMSDDEWNAPTPSPVGEVPYGEFMQLRVMDTWVHEQDIRRAVGSPGHLDGPVAATALGRFTRSLGYVVGKRAGASEGASVVVRLFGPEEPEQPQEPEEDMLAVKVIDGRARPVAPPEDPDVRLTMSAESYCCLSCGRWAAEDVLADGRVRIEGDADLGRRVLAGMSIIP